MKEFFYCCVLLSVVLVASVSYSGAEPLLDYDALVQQGKTELQAGSSDHALRSGHAAIKMSTNWWEGYALAGGALMNLKRYEEAADTLSKAIDRAPEAKQPALRDLRRQCEIVLWKSIESSAYPADFQSYLDQYPQGAFAVLARRHLTEAKTEADRPIAPGECTSPRSPNPPPDGTTASKDQMIASKHNVDRFNNEMNSYLGCIKSKIDSTSSSEQKKILAKTHNAAVNELQAAVGRFNEQIKIYKATR